MARTWSKFQQDIFAAVANPQSGSLLVQAVAGSGKSSTMVEALKYAPAGTSSIYLAFNKSIASELAAKGVNGRTFHSVCYSPVLRASGQKTVTADKLRILVRAWPRERAMLYGNAAQKLVGLARNAGIGCLVPNTSQAWLNLIDMHEVSPDDERGDEAGLVQAAQTLLADSEASPLVDFDDMLIYAVSRNIPLPRFDLIVIDESQDCSACQIAIIRKMMTPNARVLAVGDSAQSIYGFRGAMGDSMDRIAEEFDCTRMPLTVTYRCASQVVKYAKRFASEIEAAPSAPEGVVTERGANWTPSEFKDGDLVLCNTNAPLLALAYRMIGQQLPFRMMGREIGAGLVTLINKLQPKGITGLIEKLGAWQDREVSKAKSRDNPAQEAAVVDKADCIRAMVDALPENERTVPALCRAIESLFDGKTGAILSSIHRAKGLEAEQVWWLDYDRMPAKWAMRQPWMAKQQQCLQYVAATRAKSSLVLISRSK